MPVSGLLFYPANLTDSYVIVCGKQTVTFCFAGKMSNDNNPLKGLYRLNLKIKRGENRMEEGSKRGLNSDGRYRSYKAEWLNQFHSVAK